MCECDHWGKRRWKTGHEDRERGWFHAAATSLSLSLDSSRVSVRIKGPKVSSLGVSGRRGRRWSSQRGGREGGMVRNRVKQKAGGGDEQ